MYFSIIIWMGIVFPHYNCTFGKSQFQFQYNNISLVFQYTGVPVVVWTYGNGTVVPGTTVSERDSEIISVLKFPSLSLNDRGSYICTASVGLTVSPFQISKSRSSSINPGIPYIPVM